MPLGTNDRLNKSALAFVALCSIRVPIPRWFCTAEALRLMGETELSEAPVALEKGEMWMMLVETVHALPMYKNHKRYVEDVMLKETPQISPRELAVQLNIPWGEAVVLLEEVRRGKLAKGEAGVDARVAKMSDRTLMDFKG